MRRKSGMLMLLLILSGFAASVLLFSTGFSYAQTVNVSFRAGAFSNSKSLDACSRDAMAALSDSGFSQNLHFSKGQPPSIAVGGIGPNGTAIIICAQNHDVVLTLSSANTPSSETETHMMALATKLNEIMNSK